MAAFGADIRNVRQSGQNNSWSKLDLFRYSSPGVRDFTDGQDGLPAYFSVDGNTLLLQFHNQWNGNTHVDTGDPGDFQVLDPFGFGSSVLRYRLKDDERPRLDAGHDRSTHSQRIRRLQQQWKPRFRLAARQHRRNVDVTVQTVSTTSLGTIPSSWAILGSAYFSNANGPNASSSQMLTDYVPNGTMTLWWVSNGALNGLDLGQRWTNIGFISAGQFTNLGGAGISNFLVTNAVDHHLYDWWITPQNQLNGIDITAISGVPWANVGLVATGQFTANGGTNILVSNTLDHLYDWWINSNNTLGGIDLGPNWSNIAFVAGGQFTANGNTNLLVTNTVDHHLYDWWISANSTLTGIDFGAVWSNIALVTAGRFDGNTTNTEFLVQNTVDHHLYEWWITPQNQLNGIDLGLHWLNI